MRSRGIKLLALPGLLAFARSALAQGCVLCYTSAANQRPRAIHALNQGIIILLIPPIFIFLGVFAFFYLRRNTWRGTSDGAAALETPADAEPAGHSRFPLPFGRPAR